MKERIDNYPLHDSIRGHFGMELYKAMEANPDIYLVTGDLGYGMLTPHMEDHKDRFINAGASEQAMMGIAIGLAMDGKRPVTYTISSFYLRCAEPIALYVAREQLPVIMVGSGRDGDYAHDGASHHGHNAQEFMRMLGIKEYYPNDKSEVPDMVSSILTDTQPVFVSLKR